MEAIRRWKADREDRLQKFAELVTEYEKTGEEIRVGIQMRMQNLAPAEWVLNTCIASHVKIRSRKWALLVTREKIPYVSILVRLPEKDTVRIQTMVSQFIIGFVEAHSGAFPLEILYTTQT